MNVRAQDLVGFFVALAILPLSAQTTGNQAPPLPVGQIIDSVACVGDPTETYALYLPSTYTAAKRWPIIYAFDPGAYGKIPVKLYKDAAEKYGYIVAGSENSRNFATGEASRAANAVWQDTHMRLSLDERQTYTTGFSGGARIAGGLALRCPQCKIAGVIAHSAGYPDSTASQQKDSLLYFFAVGDQDFNWQEVIKIRRQREDAGAPYRVRVFAGPHQWAPAAVIEDAVEWIHLKAMQAGAESPAAPFIERFYGRMRAEADDAEKRGDALAQLGAYRSLVSVFSSFRDVKEFEAKLATLKKSAPLKQALKKEQGEIDAQNALTGDIASTLASLGNARADARETMEADVFNAMSRLKAQAEHAKNEENRLIMLRAFHDLWAQGIEAGQAELEQRDFEKAGHYFRLMGEITPDEPWPALLLAETRSAAGDKKGAIKAIREAIKRGLKNPDAVEKNVNLQTVRSDPELQKIVEDLKAKYVPR